MFMKLISCEIIGLRVSVKAHSRAGGLSVKVKNIYFITFKCHSL